MYKAKKIEAHVNVVYSQFQVKERGGSLWLTHDGVAFMEMSKDTTSAEVAELLNTARMSAITFERL